MESPDRNLHSSIFNFHFSIINFQFPLRRGPCRPEARCAADRGREARRSRGDEGGRARRLGRPAGRGHCKVRSPGEVAPGNGRVEHRGRSRACRAATEGDPPEQGPGDPLAVGRLVAAAQKRAVGRRHRGRGRGRSRVAGPGRSAAQRRPVQTARIGEGPNPRIPQADRRPAEPGAGPPRPDQSDGRRRAAGRGAIQAGREDRQPGPGDQVPGRRPRQAGGAWREDRRPAQGARGQRRRRQRRRWQGKVRQRRGRQGGHWQGEIRQRRRR